MAVDSPSRHCKTGVGLAGPARQLFGTMDQPAAFWVSKGIFKIKAKLTWAGLHTADAEGEAAGGGAEEQTGPGQQTLPPLQSEQSLLHLTGSGLRFRRVLPDEKLSSVAREVSSWLPVPLRASSLFRSSRLKLRIGLAPAGSVCDKKSVSVKAFVK